MEFCELHSSPRIKTELKASVSEIHVGLPILWKPSLFIRQIHSVTNQKTHTCPLHLFRPPAAPTPLSEKGRIRFPEAVALTNQKQCFLPQWYPKFHQEHWNLPFFCCNFHFTSALPDTPVKVSPNVVSYQLLKTASAYRVDSCQCMAKTTTIKKKERKKRK